MAQVEVPELTPLEQYNANQARVGACLNWVLTKAYGRNIPADFQPPFYLGSQNQQLVKPALVNQLISSDIYCRVCANSFKDATLKWTGHMDVIQALSRKGIYITDPHESAVTETLLMQTSPFKMNCHLAMIEALMTACTHEMVTVERVVQAVRKFSSFNASSELPYDTEDAILFWINKVCGTVRHRIGKGEVALQGAVDQVMVPVMDDLLKDLSDGCCLAVTISYYCPDALPLQDIAMSDPLGIADSLYNLQLIKHFCRDHLPIRCDHLSINDMFHCPMDLKPSTVVFLAELFHVLEVQKISVARSVNKTTVVSPVKDQPQERPTTAKTLTSTTVARPPISNATRKSFQQGALSPGDVPTLSASATDLNKSGVPPPRQTLLPRRTHHGKSSVDSSPAHGQSRRSLSLTSVEERDGIRQSVRAWEEQRSPSEDRLRAAPHRHQEVQNPAGTTSTQSQLTSVTSLGQSSASTLLGNVSIDSDMSLDLTDVSVDLSELGETPRKNPVGPILKPQQLGRPVARGHPDHLELQSVTPSSSRSSITGANHKHANPRGDKRDSVEPLQAAHVRPSKEKMNNKHTKEVESGEVVEKKSPSSVGKPSSLSLSPAVTPGYTTIACDSDGSSTPDEDYQTPSVESVPLPGEHEISRQNGATESSRNPELDDATPARSQSSVKPHSNTATPDQNSVPKPRQYEAFYVNTGEESIPEVPTSSRLTSRGREPTPVAESFVLHDQAYTAETARAAGIPVVNSLTSSVRKSGALSDLSSNESSDPELQKIRADNKARETQGSPRPQESQRPESLDVSKSSSIHPILTQDSPKTSFAQIKQQKENGDVGGSSSMSQDGNPGLSLKAQFQNKSKPSKVQKKTTFAALPNQTTWQENAEDKARGVGANTVPKVPATLPSSSELIDIKMRLEERRRQIEHGKRKMEVQWTKQRQRMGKQAFIQVINRNKSENDLQKIPELKEKSPSDERASVTRKGSHESTMEIDPRLSELVKSHAVRELPKRSNRLPSKSKVVSAPTSREQSTDREHSRASPPIDKIQDRLPNHSSQTSGSHSVSQPAKTTPANRTAPTTHWSTEDESVGASQNRLKPSPTKSRPKSYHAPESQPSPERRPLTPQTTAESTRPQSATQRGSQSLTSSTDNPNLGGYTSLDRLNSSLSELQGEIMRLSLQQDQIKSLVVHDQGTTKSTTPPPTPPTDSDKYYLYPHNSAGEPDVAGSTKLSTEVTAQSIPQSSLPHSVPQTSHQQTPSQVTSNTQPQPMYATQQQNQPVHYPSQAQPPYTAMPGFPPQYPQYMPTQAQPLPMYTVPPQYAGMTPQYQTTPQMYQQSPHMFQQAPGYPGMPQNQWPGMSPMTQQQPPPSMQPMDANHPPYSRGTFQDPPQAHNVSPNNQISMTMSGDLTAESALRHSVMTASGSSTASNTAPHTPSQAHPPLSPGGFQSPHTPTPSDIMSTSLPSPGPASPAVSSQFWVENDPASTNQAQTQEEAPPNKGFFVTFDDGPAQSRPKPKFPRDRRKDVSAERSPEKQPSRAPPTPPATSGLTPSSPVASAPPPRRRAPTESPVGFVIGEDETMVEKVSDPYAALSEMEKKKEKMLQQQMKRMQEKQAKLQKIEDKQNKLRDEQRMKQEKADQKKMEEKSRREAIFQEYLKRKTEDSADEEQKSSAGSSSSHSQVVQRRPKSKGKVARPKSQPPTSGMEDTHSVSSQSHSSQEDIHTRGRSPAPDPHGKHTGHTMALPAVDQTDAAYQQLAFGGLTHRRPPTPERQKAFGMNGADMGPTPPFSDIYSGPKLFKKPSMKSNRTIMINAISHCCLAGSVNTSVKNKVLEGIAKAEANHFVILFRDAGMQFKGVYTYDPDKEEVLKIHGVGPKQITDEMMEKFYKYNSGTKSFSEVTSTKHLSATIDAIVLQNHLWQKKPPATRRPPNQY